MHRDLAIRRVESSKPKTADELALVQSESQPKCGLGVSRFGFRV